MAIGRAHAYLALLLLVGTQLVTSFSASSSAGSFASASASSSAGGPGGSYGSVSTSISPGGSVSTSYGPNGVQQIASSYGPSSGQPQQSSSASFSGSISPPGLDSLASRGAFPSPAASHEDDPESVAIEVDGPVVGPGYSSYTPSAPNYVQPYPNINYSPQPQYQPQYQAQYQPQYVPAYQNTVPQYVPYFGFQQHFDQLRAQQEEFQRRIYALIEEQRRAILDQSNRVDSGNFAPSYGAGAGSPSSGPQGAVATANVGPQGGYQSGQIYPAAANIVSRFGESISPPSGNGNYQVFSSASSSSSVGPDGKQISKKTASVAVNDNGKITVKTVHDP